MQLREALELAATATLRRIASAHGLANAEGSTRAELISRIIERLVDAAYLEEQLRGLEDPQRRVLVAARANGGELHGVLVERAYPGAAEPLAERGLLFRMFAADGPLRGEVFTAAEELLALFPAPPSQGRPPPADEPPPAERRTSDPAFSLFALASVLARHDGAPTLERDAAARRRGGPSRERDAPTWRRRGARDLEREVRPWSEEPGGWPWQARWRFLRHLAVAAGLLVERADGGVSRGRGLVRLLDRPAELGEQLWRAYLGDGRWSDLAHAGVPGAGSSSTLPGAPLTSNTAGGSTHMGVPGAGSSSTLPGAASTSETAGGSTRGRVRPRRDDGFDATGVRRAIVAAVQQLPEASWFATDDVSEWLRQTRPALVREQLDARGLAELGSLDWAELEAPLLRYLLLGPLYWLGLVAASADGRLILRRAVPAFGVSTAEKPAATAEPCRWADVDPAEAAAAATDLLAPARARLGTLLEAERYLLLRERGRVSRYQLDQAHVAAALASGGSLADCGRQLVRLTRADLPASVAERLSAWERRFGALALRPAVVLEARSSAELDDALADEQVRPLVRGRLGPTTAEVTAADALELAARLRQRGHVPRVDAALRIGADPRRAYAGLIDEQVLEFLLLSLLAFQRARPEHLAELEGSFALLERLERQFPPERLKELRAAADRLAGEAAPPAPRRSRQSRDGRLTPT